MSFNIGAKALRRGSNEKMAFGFEWANGYTLCRPAFCRLLLSNKYSPNFLVNGSVASFSVTEMELNCHQGAR